MDTTICAGVRQSVIAAARKLRVELRLAVSPARVNVGKPVIEVLAAVLPADGDEATVATVRSEPLADLSGHLMTLVDAVPVGPGTPRGQ